MVECWWRLLTKFELYLLWYWATTEQIINIIDSPRHRKIHVSNSPSIHVYACTWQQSCSVGLPKHHWTGLQLRDICSRCCDDTGTGFEWNTWESLTQPESPESYWGCHVYWCFCELVSDLLNYCYTKLSFKLKGTVRFNDNGNRLNPVVLLQQFRMDPSKFTEEL